MDDYVSFEKSKDFNGEKKITNQDECANKHVVVIPVPVQNHGFLRTNSQCPPNDCRSDWAGQIWIRNGLQIFNGFGYCLTSQRWKNDYVVQHNCDSTSSFIWYDWDVECEELKRGMLP